MINEKETERSLFEEDAKQYGFCVNRLYCAAPEPWSEYASIATGHRWAGWLAAKETERAALREIYEVWAGSEGVPIAETATEAYLLRLIEQMRDRAAAAISRTPSDTPDTAPQPPATLVSYRQKTWMT